MTKEQTEEQKNDAEQQGAPINSVPLQDEEGSYPLMPINQIPAGQFFPCSTGPYPDMTSQHFCYSQFCTGTTVPW